MLIMAEGTIHHRLSSEERQAVLAWLGPMVDEGFMINGYLSGAADRLWMVVSAETRAAAIQRMADLPMVQDGSVTFVTTLVTAMRFR
ncbi:MAG: hypothetical protein JWN47_1502 [Frankiales bacterium]|nr:hypothetical protein [Frankiales bacterium]MDQ1690632.1 hypothetical protein [Pseudonocardiales bacterium]